MEGYRADNEAKSKMKHPSDMPVTKHKFVIIYL